MHVFAIVAAGGFALFGWASPVRSEIRIIPPEQVLDAYVDEPIPGLLVFTTPSGASYQLITSPDDPSISNPGDGSFHPVDAAVVQDAIDQIPMTFREPLDVDVFLLPYPRLGFLTSSAGGGAIFLSPGVYPIDAATAHALVAHELGHVIHDAFLPDSDSAGWSQYRTLRGIDDETIYHAGASHANRPHEIFAEDFRVLFGGALASGSGSIENASLVPPLEVPGLESFFWNLTALPVADVAPGHPSVPGLDPPGASGSDSRDALSEVTWRSYPNPVRSGGTVTLELMGARRASSEAEHAVDVEWSDVERMTVVDVSGRSVGFPLVRSRGDARWALELPRQGMTAGVYWLVVRAAGSVSAVRLQVVR